MVPSRGLGSGVGRARGPQRPWLQHLERKEDGQHFHEEIQNQTYFWWFSLPQLLCKLVSHSLRQKPGILGSAVLPTSLSHFLWNPSLSIDASLLFKTLPSTLHLT